jgi:hypothetical protein
MAGSVNPGEDGAQPGLLAPPRPFKPLVLAGLVLAADLRETPYTFARCLARRRRRAPA